MKKIIKKILLSLLIFINLTFLVACNKTYTITLHLYDEESYVLEVKKENGYELPVLDDRNEFYFKGWYDNPDFNGSPITKLNIKSNKELYAKWEYIANYKIIYCNTINGTYEETEPYEYNYGVSNFHFLEKPFTYRSREIIGYSFTKNGQLDVENVIFDEDVYENADSDGILRLYAVWGGPYEIDYDLGYGLYFNKYHLRYEYFTDFYNFILTTEDGEKTLRENGIDTLDKFIRLGSGEDIKSGIVDVSNLNTFGNIVSKYYLNIEIGGKVEEQPTTHFIGWCYQNNKWRDFIYFLIEFFAYWRTDEGYTGGVDDPNNLGNDFFASAWASLVDTGKLFYFTKDTCPNFCATTRVVNCLENVPHCLKVSDYSLLSDGKNINLPTLSLENRVFLGWYGNKEFTGNPITTLKASEVNSEINLYAHWGGYGLNYDLGQNIYNGKEYLRIAFLTDFYNFLVSSNRISPSNYTLNNFLNESLFYKDTLTIRFSRYLFRGGLELEEQPDETTFIGWCYKNDKWMPLINYFIENAPHWSNLQYPNTDGSRKDFFDSNRESFEAILSLLWNTKESSPYNTPEILECIDNMPMCMEPVELPRIIYDQDIELPILKSKEKIFGGWYDNPEFDGEPITILKVEDINQDINLYARWYGIEISYNLNYGKDDLTIAFLSDFYDFLVATGVYDPTIYTFDNFFEETSNITYSSTMADALFTSGVELEQQSESTFIGWCYKNDKWMPLINYFIEYIPIAMDSQYDFFYINVASLDTILRLLFNGKYSYEEDALSICYKKMPLCIEPVELPRIIYDQDIELPTLKTEGRIFIGWYDNPEFDGESITILKAEDIKQSIKLYAKWE